MKLSQGCATLASFPRRHECDERLNASPLTPAALAFPKSICVNSLAIAGGPYADKIVPWRGRDPRNVLGRACGLGRASGLLTVLCYDKLAHTALATPDVSAETDFATPPLTTPGEALGEGIDLIVMATGKSEQFSDEFFEPTGAPGKSNRAPRKQVALRNHDERACRFRACRA